MNAKNQFVDLNLRNRRTGISLLACVIAVVAGLAALATPPAQAQTYQVLYTFSGGSDGNSPWGGVILDAAGNLYGTTRNGGSTSEGCNTYFLGCGVVFKLDPAGQETVLYTFQGLTGFAPGAGLLQDKLGNLYGTTGSGGDTHCLRDGCGTVFKIDAAGHETVLHSFSGGSDGLYPQASLIQDATGNLYGTSSGLSVFTSASGTVFKLDAAGNETVLHDFSGPPDGSLLLGSLVRDAHGNLVGAAANGGNGTGCGTTGCGMVFKISTTGQETVIYNFTGRADGAGPVGNPIRDSAGNLYGTTEEGGNLTCNPPYGCGVVFKVDAGGVETVLYAFGDETKNGYDPSGGVVRDAAGNLYGTTFRGGAYQSGTAYKVDPSGNETLLHSFTGRTDGAYPAAGLVMDAAGNLYGTTVGGGHYASCGCGVVFKLVP